MTLRFVKLRNVKSPTRAHPQDAGLDFFIPEDTEWEVQRVPAGGHVLIPSGIQMEIPINHALIAFEKSGIATREGLIVGARVVDAEYTGEIHLHIMNPTHQDQLVKRGQKMAQFVLVPVVIADVEEYVTLGQDSDRGDKGFGSSGK